MITSRLVPFIQQHKQLELKNYRKLLSENVTKINFTLKIQHIKNISGIIWQIAIYLISRLEQVLINLWLKF